MIDVNFMQHTYSNSYSAGMNLVQRISIFRLFASLALTAFVVLIPFHISFAFTSAQWQSFSQNQSGSPTVNVYAPQQYQYSQQYQYQQPQTYWCNGSYSYAPCQYYYPQQPVYQQPYYYYYPQTYYYYQPSSYYQDYSWYSSSYGSSYYNDYSYDYYGQDYWY